MFKLEPEFKQLDSLCNPIPRSRMWLFSSHIDQMNITQIIKIIWQWKNWLIFIAFWIISHGDEAANFSSLLSMHISDPRPAPNSSMAWTWTHDDEKQKPCTSSVIFPRQRDSIIHFFSCSGAFTPEPTVYLPTGRYSRLLIGQLLHFSWPLYHFRSRPLVPYQAFS